MDLDEGTENARTVDVSGFLKLIGHAAEELTHHEDVKSVLETESAEGHDYKRPEGVVEVHGTALDDALYKCVLGGCREDVYHLEDVVEPFDIADGRMTGKQMSDAQHVEEAELHVE